MRRRNQIATLTLTFLALLSYLASVTIAAPSCQIPSIINTDTTLSPGSCDEYLQTSNVIVREGATLQLEAETIIKVDGLYILTIEGSLIARGTAENPIQFTSNQDSPQPGDWGHILFEDTSTNATFDESGNYEAGSILQYVVIEYGGGISTGFNGMIIVNGSSPFINHVTIRKNSDAAIRVRSDEDIKITNNLMTENNDDCIINVRGGGITTIKDNIIRANTGDGYCSSWSSGGSIISENIIEENEGTGISQDGPSTIITNNTILSNTVGGIFHTNGYAYIADNSIIGNKGPYGAGIRVTGYGASAPAFIYHNTILSNTASSKGGGLYLTCTLHAYTVQENVIRGNKSDQYGGGIMLNTPCDEARFIFNDIYDNDATFGNNFYNDLSSIYSDINARANYWGTGNESEIEEGIYHQIDNTARGFVDYSNYLSEPISSLSHLYLPTVSRSQE